MEMKDALKKDSYSNHIVFRMSVYCILMLFGVILRTYVTHSVTIVWIVNIISITICFYPYLQKVSAKVLFECVMYLVFCCITLAISFKYFTNSLKSIGSNINIIIVPIYLILINYINKTKPFNDEDLKKLCFLISLMGTLSLFCTWVINGNDLLRAITGRIKIYRADVDGFFYHKNIYGAFVTLSIGADLYLYEMDYSWKRLWLIALKSLAVVLSFSRAALLQLGIMMFVFLWTKKKHRVRDVVLLLCIVGLVVSVLATNESVVSFIRNRVFRVNVGDAGRASDRVRAFGIVASEPINMIFGVGFSGLDYLNLDIDNTYLYLLFTGGIIKIAFFAYWYLAATKKTKELRSNNMLVYRLGISFSISYLVYAFFESVAVLELGLLNFLDLLYVFLIPYGYKRNDIITEKS